MDTNGDLRDLGVEWCKKEDIGVENAILLVGRPVECTIRSLLLTVSKALPSGIKSVARRNVTLSGVVKTIVLCEYGTRAPLEYLGESVAFRVGGSMNQFKVIKLTDRQESAVERMSMLDLEGDTHSDVQPSSRTPDHPLPMSERATTLYTSSTTYRKLRFFSGKSFPAKDEENWETWIEQAEAQVEEWNNIPYQEIRKRIRKSLRSPALEIIADLRQEKKDAKSIDYLIALEMAFGSTDSNDELLMKFYSLHQREGEKASEYLLRLQQLLRKIRDSNEVPCTVGTNKGVFRKLFQMHKVSAVNPVEASSPLCAKIFRDIERAEKFKGITLAEASIPAWCHRINVSPRDDQDVQNVASSHQVPEGFEKLPFTWGPISAEWKDRFLSLMAGPADEMDQTTELSQVERGHDQEQEVSVLVETSSNSDNVEENGLGRLKSVTLEGEEINLSQQDIQDDHSIPEDKSDADMTEEGAHVENCTPDSDEANPEENEVPSEVPDNDEDNGSIAEDSDQISNLEGETIGRDRQPPKRCTLSWLWTRHFDGIQAGIPMCGAGYLYIATTCQVTGQTLVSYPFITPSETK
ncbi:Paraneoplastic antigen Ma1-like [Holothuria leucospilota]|uniref:Paraneoplastic antigen Ma1-like n=1 Tax=Holothuria leucospilota TaxID=206669 RepID=A0A9Q1B9X5_HOLLE|nr:Paraneoplastic antigen Ma1-like [Holothuria leucospilota]